MVLVVEDGTGLTTADSYLSVSAADAYHVARNNLTWAERTEVEKEAALRYATAWLDGRFRWIGRLLNGSQKLGWPRTVGVAAGEGEYWSQYDDEGRLIEAVPWQVKEVVAELALIHATSVALNRVVKPDQAISSITVGGTSAGVTITKAAPFSDMQVDYVVNRLRNLYQGGGIGGTRRIAMERA